MKEVDGELKSIVEEPKTHYAKSQHDEENATVWRRATKYEQPRERVCKTRHTRMKVDKVVIKTQQNPHGTLQFSASTMSSKITHM